MADLDDSFKICIKCGQLMPLSRFSKNKSMASGLLNSCKPCGVAYNVQRNRRPDVRKKRSAAFSNKWKTDPEFRAKHSEHSKRYFGREDVRNAMAARMREYRASNSCHVSQIKKEQYKIDRQNPAYMLAARIRAGVRHSLKRAGKSGRTFHALGYTKDDLAAHLERQFTKGMSWENIGEWHIDHIVPISSFKIRSMDSDEFRRAWALSNLRPLWAVENFKKRDKRTHLI